MSGGNDKPSRKRFGLIVLAGCVAPLVFLLTIKAISFASTPKVSYPNYWNKNSLNSTVESPPLTDLQNKMLLPSCFLVLVGVVLAWKCGSFKSSENEVLESLVRATKNAPSSSISETTDELADANRVDDEQLPIDPLMATHAEPEQAESSEDSLDSNSNTADKLTLLRQAVAEIQRKRRVRKVTVLATLGLVFIAISGLWYGTLRQSLTSARANDRAANADRSRATRMPQGWMGENNLIIVETHVGVTRKGESQAMAKYLDQSLYCLCPLGVGVVFLVLAIRANRSSPE